MRPHRTGRFSLAVVVVAGLVVTACGMGGGAPPAEGDMVAEVSSVEAGCLPSATAMARDGTLVGRAGRYSLTMVQMVGATPDTAADRTVEGSLVLLDQAAELGMLAGVSTPLYGSADIDLEGVGAHRVGDLASEDPTVPGVLVMEQPGSGGALIRLRLGSEANRRDVSAFDGGYTVLTVTEMAPGGFRGRWASGAQGPTTGGYFCADGA